MKLSMAKGIRLNCLDCSAGSSNEVKRCELTDCPLWPYRLGRKPTAEEAADYAGPGDPVLKSEAAAARARERAKAGGFGFSSTQSNA